MDNKIKFSYFSLEESDMLTFYRIPKPLMTDPYFRKLSSDAKILYGIMLDRMSLSAKNGWVDNGGHVYIYFSIEDIMEYLGCGRNKAVGLLKELDEKDGIGLIEKRRQGQGKPTIFYVKNFSVPDEAENPEVDDVDNSAEAVSEVSKSNFKKYKNQTSRSLKSKLLEVPKSNSNYTEYNKTESNDIKSNLISSPERFTQMQERSDEMDKIAAYESIIKENIEYDSLIAIHPHEKQTIDGICDLILETVLSENQYITIASDRYPKDLVKSKFLKLNYSHIEYVLECMENNRSKARNIKKYMLAALFNAPNTMDSYYLNQVKSDMADI